MTQSDVNGISIITIVLNGESLIEETILSVIQQKKVNIEYIIIDGGSSDETLNIISKYNDKIDLVISEPDKGIYHAINKGINLATNHLVGLIHCGDFYEPNALFMVCKEFKKTGADVIYGDINIIEFFPHKTIAHKSKADHNLLKKKMSIFHPATFLSRECYIKYGLYNTNYKITADYELLLNLYLKNLNFKYIPKVLTNFRAGGISSSKTNILVKENFSIRKNHLGLINALAYIISAISTNMFYAFRKSFIELIIGKQNFTKLRFYILNKRGSI